LRQCEFPLSRLHPKIIIIWEKHANEHLAQPARTACRSSSPNW
jgi:hypothetical protein